MLMLSLKAGQSVVIAGNVKVKVFQVEGEHVKLGIEAPKEIAVHREEIQAPIARSEPAQGSASATRAS